MDLSLQVAPTLPSLRTDNISEALLFAQQLTVETLTRNLGDLTFGSLDPATSAVAVVTDKLQGELKEAKMTKHAIMNLCRILGIPDPFARKIPNDLLLTNIRRLQGVLLDQTVVLLLRPDRTVAGIVKKKYNEVPYADIVGAIESKAGIKYIDIGENLMTVCFVHETLKFPDPISTTNDYPLYVGSYMYASILATKPLHMKVGLYRTACSNSFVGVSLGRVKADYKLSPESRALLFAERIGTFDEDVLQRFTRNLPRLSDYTLYTHELASVWQKMKTQVGINDADRIIDYTADVRKQLIDTVSVWKKANKRSRLIGESVLDPVRSDRNLFDVMNSATTFAHTLVGIERTRLEEAAGKIVEKSLLSFN